MTDSKSPLFSVIIPTLGKVDLWLEAITSVRAQTFQGWEIIAIDSGEESISRAAIESLHDQRIRYVSTAQQPPQLNWDAGYRHATGRYLMWLDDDNYLLPHALETLARLTSTHADFVTGNHMHWNDHYHPIKNLRNNLVIPSRGFSGRIITIDPLNAVKKLFGIPYPDEEIFARFHTSAQAVRKEIIDKLVARIGHIDFRSTSTHTLRIGALALSRSVQFADVAIALIAQSGKSMSMIWPKESSSIKHVEYEYHLSEVHANTYINYVHENHLLLKQKFADKLSSLKLPRAKFLMAYAKSLIYLDQPWKDLRKHWDELARILQASNEPQLRALQAKLPHYRHLSLAGWALRKVGLYTLAQHVFSSQRKTSKALTYIPLRAYGVTSMHECAVHIHEIIENETHEKYLRFVGLPLQSRHDIVADD